VNDSVRDAAAKTVRVFGSGFSAGGISVATDATVDAAVGAAGAACGIQAPVSRITSNSREIINLERMGIFSF
jgi:poly(3-hydroxybutyrate) depolymerase